MNAEKKNPQKPVSNSDSFFGMAIAQAFLGVAFGPCVDGLWEAGEIASAAYEDRKAPKISGGSDFALGVKNRLGDVFTRTTAGPAPAPFTGFGFSLSSSTPSMAF